MKETEILKKVKKDKALEEIEMERVIKQKKL